MKILLVDDSNTMRRIEKSTLEKAIQAGAANYVVKPFQPETLQEKISAVAKKPA